MNFLKILKLVDNLNSDNTIKTIINSVNKDQIENKKWLIEKLTPYLHIYEKPKILVVAGWYGLLADMLSKQLDDNVYTSDKDSNCAKIGIKMFNDKVKYITKDIANYKEHHLEKYDVLICTSCEHIDDELINSFIGKKRKDSLVVLQSNNFVNIEDHINCKKSLKDFEDSVNLNVQFKDTKSFEKYDRYMIIGT